MPPPNFANTSRIDQIMRDGKMYLSMNDAIALALENNLDIAIARYNLPIADTDVLLSKAGSATRGVNSGVVQNTPGGGGAGSIGIRFERIWRRRHHQRLRRRRQRYRRSGHQHCGRRFADRIVRSHCHRNQPGGARNPVIADRVLLRCSILPVEHDQRELCLQPVLAHRHHGQLRFNNNRTTTNLGAYSPQIDSSFRLTFSQHLLQGWGFLPNERFIRIAKNDRKITDSAFRQQVRETVSQIQNIYWDLVAAYEDVKVKQRALEFASRTFSDNQKQVQIGTLAPIEVVHAQSTVSTAQQDLIVSQTNLQLEQLLMKNAITRNLGDPILAAAEVIPTDTMRVDDTDQLPAVDQLIKTAQDSSPEIEQAKLDLTNRDITNRSAKNALLPTLDAYAFYGASALKGVPVTPIFPLHRRKHRRAAVLSACGHRVRQRTRQPRQQQRSR